MITDSAARLQTQAVRKSMTTESDTIGIHIFFAQPLRGCRPVIVCVMLNSSALFVRKNRLLQCVPGKSVAT